MHNQLTLSLFPQVHAVPAEQLRPERIQRSLDRSQSGFTHLLLRGDQHHRSRPYYRSALVFITDQLFLFVIDQLFMFITTDQLFMCVTDQLFMWVIDQQFMYVVEWNLQYVNYK